MISKILESRQTTIIAVVSLVVVLGLVYYVYKSTYGLKRDVNLLEQQCSEYASMLQHHDTILQQFVSIKEKQSTPAPKQPSPMVRETKLPQPNIIMTMTTPSPTRFTPKLETIIEEDDTSMTDEELDKELEEELEKIKTETVEE